jgi:ABC-type branched-subunit amino acid transport system substrate-binding protein
MPDRQPIVASLVLASLSLAFGCGGNDGTGSRATFDLVIGNLAPLSGDLADFGPPDEKSAELAVEQIRAAIDEVGSEQTVELRQEDSQTDPQAAVEAARKLVADGAGCLVGPLSTAETIPVTQSVAVPGGILQISPGSTSDDTTEVEDDDLLNRTILPNRLQGQALADLLEQRLGGAEGSVVNIGARNDAYGTGLAETFASAWEERGGEVGEEVIYDPEQPSYDSEARVLVEGDPDGWVIIDFPETFGVIGPALARTGRWDPSRAFVTEGLYSSSLPDEVGPAVVEGITGTNPGSPDDDPAAMAFDALYASSPGPKERQASDAQTFDAVILCYLAAVAAGGTDGPAMAEALQAVSGPPGERLTFEQLPEAIEALENGDDIDYEGAAGPIGLDTNGDPTAGVYDLFGYRHGQLVELGEVPIAPGG